jgi:hypothetical protein
MPGMDTTWDTRWPDPLLDHLRTVGDPLADAAVAELMEANRAARPAAGETLDLVALLRERARAAPGACRQLVEQVDEVPVWASFADMRVGYRVGLSYPVAAGLSLLCGSLVESYAAALGAKVLVRTGNLARSTRRRVYETAEFLHVLARSDGPAPGSAAHRALLQLRLIHAHIRAAMQRRSDWDARWGRPVNQEDYGATLLSFSLVFVRSMQRLGVPVSAEQLDSIHHGWRYAGHVLGIDARMLTETRAAEAALYQRIVRRQHRPDADSQALTRTLFAEMAWQPPFMFPAAALHAVCRRLVGDALADELQVPKTPRWRAIPAGVAALSQAQHALAARLPGGGELARRLGTRLVESILDYGLAAERGPRLGQQAGFASSGTPSPAAGTHSGGR